MSFLCVLCEGIKMMREKFSWNANRVGDKKQTNK